MFRETSMLHNSYRIGTYIAPLFLYFGRDALLLLVILRFSKRYQVYSFNPNSAGFPEKLTQTLVFLEESEKRFSSTLSVVIVLRQKIDKLRKQKNHQHKLGLELRVLYTPNLTIFDRNYFLAFSGSSYYDLNRD